MPFYHPSKDAALLAGALYADHFFTRAEFVPYNGWVLVLQPKSLKVFEWPLATLLQHAEIDLTGYQRLAQKPADYKRPPAAAIAKPPSARPPAPPKAPAPPPPSRKAPAAPPPPPPPPAR